MSKRRWLPTCSFPPPAFLRPAVWRIRAPPVARRGKERVQTAGASLQRRGEYPESIYSTGYATPPKCRRAAGSGFPAGGRPRFPGQPFGISAPACLQPPCGFAPRRSRGAGKSACKRPGLHCSVVENIRNQFIRQGMPHRQNAAGLPAQASPPAAARVSPASRLAYPRPASVAAMPPIAVSRSSIGSWRPTRYIASTT